MFSGKKFCNTWIDAVYSNKTLPQLSGTLTKNGWVVDTKASTADKVYASKKLGTATTTILAQRDAPEIGKLSTKFLAED